MCPPRSQISLLAALAPCAWYRASAQSVALPNERCGEKDDPAEHFTLGGGGHALETCVETCRVQASCNFVTFYERTGYCHMYRTCGERQYAHDLGRVFGIEAQVGSQSITSANDGLHPLQHSASICESCDSSTPPESFVGPADVQVNNAAYVARAPAEATHADLLVNTEEFGTTAGSTVAGFDQWLEDWRKWKATPQSMHPLIDDNHSQGSMNPSQPILWRPFALAIFACSALLVIAIYRKQQNTDEDRANQTRGETPKCIHGLAPFDKISGETSTTGLDAKTLDFKTASVEKDICANCDSESEPIVRPLIADPFFSVASIKHPQLVHIEREPTRMPFPIEELQTDAPDGSEEYLSDSASENVGALHATSRLKRAVLHTTFLASVDPSNESLGRQVLSICKEAFGEDENVFHRGNGVRVAALLLDGRVVGFASYSVCRKLLALSVHKLAVAQEHRRRGLGRSLLRNLICIAKRRGRGEAALEVVSLSALSNSVAFYRACGFRVSSAKTLKDSNPDIMAGQVYMEFRLPWKKSKRSVSRRRIEG